ncbi:MAG: hypothetical protein HY544_01895 [Candidatus Diapherotrites archaeon]|uniref:Uncharacterized protein n=1 Tax=Candidatus Iainarchaeum sp. TaxID=3101447 RepID=A0A8T3YPZ8_9ARCH|nr:hypothetical protein [Candidatus Diapherotrites archaeon]
MDENMRKNVVHLVILFVLLLALAGVLVYTGIVSCNVVPGGCEIYYKIKDGARAGQPQVLIAYGDSGLGDNQKLGTVFSNPDILRAQVREMHVDRLSYGNVRDYDLIIVTHAKTICSDKLKVFQYFVNSGGRLVWTGDAGTGLCTADAAGRYPASDTLLLDKERNQGGTSTPIGPWARKDGKSQLSFDELLGVEYKGNYCEFSKCAQGQVAGTIEVTNTSHKLTYGLSPAIPFTGDFAVVEFRKSDNVRLIATLDYGTDFLGKSTGQPWLESGKTYNFGRNLPFIVASQVGERAAYYAVPIESLVSEEQPQKNKALLEQMYYGMLYG